MKIALLGYGRMGKEIEKIAVSRGHEIVIRKDVDDKIDINNNGEDDIEEIEELIEEAIPDKSVVGNVLI